MATGVVESLAGTGCLTEISASVYVFVVWESLLPGGAFEL